MLRLFNNCHFVRVCMEKIMDHHYWKNGTRNIHSNYYQTRANIECSPNQSQTIIPYRPFDGNFEDSGKVLAVSYLNFRRVLQFFSTRWLSLKSIPWILGEFRHKLFQRMSVTQRKVRSGEDDDLYFFREKPY